MTFYAHKYFVEHLNIARTFIFADQRFLLMAGVERQDFPVEGIWSIFCVCNACER